MLMCINVIVVVMKSKLIRAILPEIAGLAVPGLIAKAVNATTKNLLTKKDMSANKTKSMKTGTGMIGINEKRLREGRDGET